MSEIYTAASTVTRRRKPLADGYNSLFGSVYIGAYMHPFPLVLLFTGFTF